MGTDALNAMEQIPDSGFAVKYECGEAGPKNNPITRHGKWVWICLHDGYMSSSPSADPPKDVIVYPDEDKAHEVGKTFQGAPWWHKSTGNYEVVPLRPKIIQVVDGWEVAPPETPGPTP